MIDKLTRRICTSGQQLDVVLANQNSQQNHYNNTYHQICLPPNSVIGNSYGFGGVGSGGGWEGTQPLSNGTSMPVGSKNGNITKSWSF